MIRSCALAVLALALTASLAGCGSIDFPDELPAGAPASAAKADNDTAASRADVEKRQRRLARKRDKACEKHPENC
jgi:hypothetical protein